MDVMVMFKKKKKKGQRVVGGGWSFCLWSILLAL